MIRNVLKIVVRSVLIDLLAGGAAFGLSTWTVGEEEHPWEKVGSLWALETTSRAGWLLPEHTELTVNLMQGILEREGTMWSPQGYMKPPIVLLTDGDFDEKWSVMQSGGTLGGVLRGAFMQIDLGAIFPVNRVVFYTGEGQDPVVNILRGYEVWINDGDPKKVRGGTPIYEFVTSNTENEDPVIDIRFRTQYVRYIKLVVTSDYGFATSEIEAYGGGYTPEAIYLSDPIDLGGAANFGKVRISAEIDPEARIALRTRTGSTPDPYLYYRKTGVGAEEILLSKEEYESLLSAQKGQVVFDAEHWSAWSVPYPTTAILAGTRMASPGNRRYVQFKIDFSTESFGDRASVDFLSLEYSTPPVAHEIIGEIGPQEVSLGHVTTFKYYIHSTVSGDDTGLDGLEIQTPYQATVQGLKIDGSSVDFLSQAEPNRLRVLFPDHRVTADRLLELSFGCLVTISGTIFGGKVFDSQTDEVPQDVVPGDATPDVDTNDLSVMGSSGRSLFASVDVLPNPFTPNGDGVNDLASLSYMLLKLKKNTTVRVLIYDVKGELVRSLYSKEDRAGPNVVEWDGTDDTGRLLQPGLYIYRLSVDADAGVSAETGTIGLVY